MSLESSLPYLIIGFIFIAAVLVFSGVMGKNDAFHSRSYHGGSRKSLWFLLGIVVVPLMLTNNNTYNYGTGSTRKSN
jgi:hypothetical protein